MAISVSAMDLMSFMQDVMERKGIAKPSRQPLFQYHVTSSEYQRLKMMLRDFGKPAIPRKNKAWCAAFCLFCAEWYRREYIQGWSWEGIWTELGFDLDANERGDVVYKGLTEFWQRPVSTYHDERNSYLGSLFSEGGLPYALISRDGSRIIGILKKILRSYDDIKAVGSSTHEFIRSQLSSLPEAFQKDTTVELVSRMVELILHLTEKHALDEQADIVGYLDLHESEWRKQFPIPMDTNTGSDLINSLFRSASIQRRERALQKSRVFLEQRLSNNTEELSIIANIKLAKVFDIQTPAEKLSSARVEVFLQEGNAILDEITVGQIQTGSDDKTTLIYLRKPGGECSRRQPANSLFLVFTQAGKQIHREEIPGSDLQIGSIPIVLKGTNDHRIILGAGSISHRSERLSVLLPEDASLVTDNAQIFDVQPFSGLGHLEFSGDLKVTLARDEHPDVYLISTKANVNDTETVLIEGRTLDFLSKEGQPVYLGVPRFRSSNYSAQTWIGNKLADHIDTADCYGKQSVKLKNTEGVTLYHKRLNILPDDLELKLIGGDSARSGSIEIKSTKSLLSSVQVACMNINTVRMENGRRFELKAEDKPPSELRILIQANLESLPIEVVVPFPSKGALAFSEDGTDLPKELTVDELLGSRVVFYPSALGNAHYAISIRGSKFQTNLVASWNYQVGQLPVEVKLYDLRNHITEMLAATGDLDAKVSIEISGDCKTQQYRVGNYSALLNRNDRCVEVIQSSGPSRMARPVLIDLADPLAKPKVLNSRRSEGVETGVYELEDAFETPSLIVPSPETEVKFRAGFIPGKRQFSTETVETLNKAVSVFHPSENKHIISTVLLSMSRNFSHTSWNFISNLYDYFSYLPLSTFEVWKSAVKHESVLASIAFRLEQPLKLMQALQEQFNVSWELVSLQAWKDASKNYLSFMLGTGLPESVVSTLLESKIKSLSAFSPLLAEGFISDDGEIVVNQKIGEQLYLAVMPGYFQGLLRISSDIERWPIAYGRKIERMVLSNLPILKGLINPSDYQKAVTFAPFLSAMIVTGHSTLKDLFGEDDSPSDYFQFKQLIEFDRQWFEATFLQTVGLLTNGEAR
ncbi:MAG: STY4851/ECs_5259 family protein [Reinekea sp.]